MKNLIIDGNNIIYRTFHANNKSGEPADVVIDLCMLSLLHTINRYYNMFKPDDIIVTFDDYSWRKEYTKDLSKCVTNKKYKAHRREGKSSKELEMFRILDEHIDELYVMMRDQTSIITLKERFLEGDDLMAGYVQLHRDDENIILSGDKDMMQLLRYEDVTLINPDNAKERTLVEYDNDADLFLFEKCIRGEAKTNDNIQSSYPRLFKKKLVKAYYDEYERNNIMNHTFKQLELLPDGEYGDVEYTTKDLFKENQTLMDLRKQPRRIKTLMVKTIDKAKEGRGKYNHLKFLQYCSRNNLDKIITSVEDFVPMLSINPRKD